MTLDDFTLFLRGYQNQGAPLTALEQFVSGAPQIGSAERQALLAAIDGVPEPYAAATVGIGFSVAAFLSRRRRA